MPQGHNIMRRYSLKASLAMLVAVCIFPMALVSAVLLYQNYQLLRQQIDQQSILVARKAVVDLEKEFSSIESGLKVLATSPDLLSGDLASFHQRARKALSTGIVYNYILTDMQGHQVLNTLVPFGNPLPVVGTPEQLGRVFTDRQVTLTDLFIGPVTQRPAIAMGAPVFRDGEVIYSLNIGLDPERVSDILRRQALPDGWLVAVLDSSGTIVGRTRDADKYIGQKAVPAVAQAVARQSEGRLESYTKDGIAVFSTHVRSERWHWSAVVGAPLESLQEELQALLSWVVVGTLTAVAVGLWIALTLGGRVIYSVRGLNAAATDLVEGRAVQMPDIQLMEADAVGLAIQRAAHAMEQVKYLAQHDSLTGLANRLMFQELASRQLALSERNHEHMAIIALDLDGFKQVNDTYGHSAGDEVLKAAAERILNETRASDAVARLGGDEFIVLLCEANAERAMQTTQRVVQALGEPYTGIESHVSASAGVAIYPEHGSTLASLIAAADRAMYQAKEAGRNRAVQAVPLPPESAAPAGAATDAASGAAPQMPQ